jgi:hypothetical protein
MACPESGHPTTLGHRNKLHWALDVSFGEDLDRKRNRPAAQNFSLLNRIAHNLLKQDNTCKLGLKGKRLKASWDNEYLNATTRELRCVGPGQPWSETPGSRLRRMNSWSWKDED